MSVLVIAEHDNESLKVATLNTIAAALALSNEVDVLVAGSSCQNVGLEVAKAAGVTKVLVSDAQTLATGLAENVSTQVLQIAKNYSHILFASTAQGKNVAPRVAALLDVAQVSDVIRVIDANTFERPIYAGNAIATVESSDAIKVLTIRTTAFDPVATGSNAAKVESLDAVSDSGKSAFLSKEIAKSDRPELAGAKIIVSGGRAL